MPLITKKNSNQGGESDCSSGRCARMESLRHSMEERYKKIGTLSDPGLLAMSAHLDELVVKEMRSRLKHAKSGE